MLRGSNRAQKNQQAGIFQPLGNPQKRWRGGTNRAQGKATGWDFSAFRKHTRKEESGMNQAKENQQAGIFVPVAEQLLNFHSTIHYRDEF